VPLGVGVALFITQYAPRWLSRTAASLVDLLAAVPSIVYGLWGLITFSSFFKPVQGFVEDSLGAALSRKTPAKPSRERTLDGRAEARLIALACSPPPDGRKRWTMQLLADERVELEVVDAVSDETVRRTLQKTRSSRG